MNKVIALITGLPDKIVDALAGMLPDTMSDAEKANATVKVQQAAHKHTVDLLDAAKEQEAEFSKRIGELEGTAKDLLAAGRLGRAVLFLRGLQRPLWGYAVLVLDFMVFSGNWDVKLHDKVVKANDAADAVVSAGLDIEMVFWTINLLVLGFLFGERAVKNVLPMVREMRAAKGGGTNPV